MTGDKLALGSVAALAALGLAKRRGGRNLPPGAKEKLIELTQAGHVDQAIALSEALGAPLDLSGAKLMKLEMNNVDLSGANLSGADLRASGLNGANLSGANLIGSDLSWAQLWRANLRGADLSGANLTQVNLSGADLAGADLSGAYLAGANLIWADLTDITHDEMTMWPMGFRQPPLPRKT